MPMRTWDSNAGIYGKAYVKREQKGLCVYYNLLIIPLFEEFHDFTVANCTIIYSFLLMS